MSSEPDPAGTGCLIVGYDRSDSSRLAATWAARELGPSGKLVLVHSCRGQHLPPSGLSTAKERHDLGRALIDELLMETDSLRDVELAADISDEDPVSALIAAARRHDARGIVLGHQPHSPLHRALGTVTSELLSRSPVPVTSVPLSVSALPTSGGRP